MAAFTDPRLGVFTSTIVRDGAPVLLVLHDDDDEWQFLSGRETRAEEAVFVHLEHLINADSTLHEVADLDRGWKAWRATPNDPWTRGPTTEGQLAI